MSVKRHTAYNILGAVVPLGATLFTLPIYLRAIGEERYGVLAILWTLLGYFGLFDLGLGRAVTNRIAALSDRTAREREEVFWTALLLNLALGTAGALALWGAGAVVFEHFVDVPGPLTGEVYAALPWMVLAFPLLLASSVMTGALMGREEFLAQNAVDIGTGLLIQVVPLVTALMVGPALPALVLAVLGVRVLGGISLLGLCMRRLPIGLHPRVERAHVRPLFEFGGWVAVSSIVGPLLTTLDRVLIGAVAGVKAVTYYTVPFNLASRLSILPGSLAVALFPRFSSLDDEERDVLFASAVRALVVILAPIMVGGLLIMEPFLTWWIGAEFAANAAPVGEILVLGLWANCLAYIPFAQIQGRGRPDIAAKFHLAELMPYLGVLWLALQWKGAVGAAIAVSLRYWVDAALMFWASRFRDVPLILASVAIPLLAGATVVLVSGTSWQGLVIRGGVVAAATLGAWLAAPSELKQWTGRMSRRLQPAEAANA